MELETLLTPEQLAERLGVPISWVYRHSAPSCDPEQRLPSLKVGRHIRFGPAAIAEWLDAHCGGVLDAPGGPAPHRNADSSVLAGAMHVPEAQPRANMHGAHGRDKPSSSETEGGM
jgi:excisionase family DNA binding protein